MQILQHQLNQFQFSTTNSISLDLQDIVSKSKKIIKNKKQSISKKQIKKYLFSKLKKARAPQKTFQSKLSSFQENLKKLQMDKSCFCCPICIELLIQPIVTDCGHAFCHKCLQSFMEYNSKCPVCRKEVQRCQIKVQQNLNNLLNKFNSQSFTDYLFQCQRNYESFDWLLRKRSGFQFLQPGQYIDIKCLTTNKWTQGCIIQIRTKEKSNYQKQVYVSYTQNQKSNKEWLNLNSSRLAHHQFFTGIKKFKHLQQSLIFFEPSQSIKNIEINVPLEREQFDYVMNQQRKIVENQKNMYQQTENEQADQFLSKFLNEKVSNIWDEVDML